jgi:hypothetical protein
VRTALADAAWWLWIASFAVLEAYTLFNQTEGDTLSERFRAWFHTHTKLGRAIFTVTWSGFATWFLLHILTQTM